MGPSKIILIGVLVQLAAVISSVLAPRIQERLGVSNQRLLLCIAVLAEIIPAYACIGLILPFGGLRTEGEMYVAATWFGLVCRLSCTGPIRREADFICSYMGRSTATLERSMLSSFHR